MGSSTLPTLAISSTTLPLSTVVYLVTLILLAVYIIYSVILYYHWNHYATDGKVKKRTLQLYFSTTITLLIIMGVCALLL